MTLNQRCFNVDSTTGLCHEIGAFIESICFHQSIKYVLLINFHQTCDFLTGYDLNDHMSVESCINSKYCVNYERLKTEENKENHKVTHSPANKMTC